MKFIEEEKKKIEETRMEYAKRQLEEAGYDVIFESDVELRFYFKEQTVRLFAYTGWFTGKSVKDGRGISNLIKQIKNK